MNFDLKLKSIEFKNFRLFEEFEMDFHPNLTVLIGENGSGKTSLLDGIAKMLTPISIYLENPFWNGVPDKQDLFRDVITEKDFAIEKEEITCNAELLITIENELNTVNNSIKHPKEYLRSKSRPNNQFTKLGILELSRKLRANKIILKNIPIIVYYRCEKTDDISQNGQTNVLEENNIFSTYDNALTEKSIDYQSFLDWYKWQEDRELRGKGSSILKIVKKAILSMLNDEKENKFTDIFIDVSSFKNYKLKIVKKDFELELDQLSSGERSLLALVSDIARRIAIANPESNDPLKEGTGIALIDEIDLHLHPRWQRKVLRKLREIFPKVQFVVTAHSPLIIGSIKSENIRLLEDGKAYSIPETLGQNVGVIIKQIMGVEESIYDKELKQIFRLLAKNNIDEAKKEIENIEIESPADIPELREAKAILKRKEILSE